jgi:hypothetical protein
MDNLINYNFKPITERFYGFVTYPVKYSDVKEPEQGIERTSGVDADFHSIYYQATDGREMCIADFVRWKDAKAFEKLLESVIQNNIPRRLAFENTEPTKEIFAQKLKNFMQAAEELSIIWTECNDDEVNDTTSLGYPFPYSFDDMEGRIQDWGNHTLELFNRKKRMIEVKAGFKTQIISLEEFITDNAKRTDQLTLEQDEISELIGLGVGDNTTIDIGGIEFIITRRT